MKKIIFVFVLLFFVLINFATIEKSTFLNKKGLVLSEENVSWVDHELLSKTKTNILQRKTGNHILGFRSSQMYIASATHLLNVEFFGANETKPVSDTGALENANGKVIELDRVSYNNLWKNISLVYDKTDSGVYKSTYYIEPSAMGNDPVEKIRLKYNVPVKINKNGQLVFTFETGNLTESKPIAWQDINGKRIFIDVKYKQNGESEIGFAVGDYDQNYKLVIDPTLTWNTFIGIAGAHEDSKDIAIDNNNNIFITGNASDLGASYGTPVNANNGGNNIFIAKLDNDGTLLWHTYLGVAHATESGIGIACDNNGDIYVTGKSYGSTWNVGTSPVNTYAGDQWDVFVAKLNTNGGLLWHTFLGASNNNPNDIAIDSTGTSIYVAGQSYTATWGSNVVSSYNGAYDGFIVKLNCSDGVYQWNTFMGSSSSDYVMGIAIDSTDSKLIVSGHSQSTWGTPHNAHAGGNDLFVAEFNTSGVLQWNNFLGGSDSEYSRGIALDNDNDIYIIGNGRDITRPDNPANPGNELYPVRAYTFQSDFSHREDVIVAKFNGSDGNINWYTFLHRYRSDYAMGIVINSNEDVYVSSYSRYWRDTSYLDGFNGSNGARINSLTNDQMRNQYDDYMRKIALDSNENLFATGRAWEEFMGNCSGTPINSHSGPGGSGGNYDIYVGKIDVSRSSVCGQITYSGGTPLENVELTGFLDTTTTNSNGDYLGFLNANTPATITPVLVGYTFDPVNQEYSSGVANHVTRNFTATIIDTPVVTEITTTNITTTTADSGGEVVYIGTSAVTARGVCWGTSTDPVISGGNITTDGSGIGSFTSNITGLTLGTTYYVRAYATNSSGTSYGANQSFTTLSIIAPTVTTTAISAITHNSAASGGNVTSNGGASVTARGVCWSTSTNPTTSDSTTSDSTGTGSFTSSITGLSSNTLYYVRAYATNNVGTSYGSEQSFTTAVATPSITVVSPILNGNLEVGSRKNIIWNAVNLSNNVEITLWKDGILTGTIATGLSPGTVNYYWTVGSLSSGSASSGIGYTIKVKELGRSVEDMSEAFNIKALLVVFSPNGNENLEVGSLKWITWIAEGFNNDIKIVLFKDNVRQGFIANSIDPAPGRYKWEVRNHIKNKVVSGSGYKIKIKENGGVSFNAMDFSDDYFTITGSSVRNKDLMEQYSFNRNTNDKREYDLIGNVSIITKAESRATSTLSTVPITDLTPTRARSGGDITSDGGSAVTARGVCWSTSANPTLSDFFAINGEGTGSYSSFLTGLTSGTTYYVRAYAINDDGTSYGDEGSFTTLSASIPTVTTSQISYLKGTDAGSGGDITEDGGASVTERGICWSTSTAPTTADRITANGTGTGSFISAITGLNPKTSYYVRAYATNSIGTHYGNELSFTTTAAVPTVITTGITGVTNTSASSGGNVTSDGGGSVTARGVCWSTSPYPSLSDSHTNDRAGKGNFVSSLTGLIPGTVYYVRAYAENSGGRAFGKTVTFATLESFPEIEITEPLNGAIVNGLIGITAEATAPGNPVEFYIDDVLLGNGIANRSKNSISSIILNKIDVVFDINNSEYLFIDSENILKKILTDGNIDNVFDKDIIVEDIQVNSIGEVYIRFGPGITLYGYDNARDIMIDVVNKTVSGINKTDFEIKKEHILIEFNKYIDSYSLFSDHRNPAERKTIAFLKKRPVKVIKNIVSSPFNLNTRTDFSLASYNSNNNFKTDILYTINWDTMNHSDGLHKIKVLAYDRFSRSFSDEIEVFIRKLKIVLSAIRKEDMALTFRINSAELTFKVENPEELPVAKYIVYRSVAGGEFGPISEIDPLTVIDNQYKCYDARISLEKIYSYKVIAYDSSGNILSESEIKSI